MYNRKTNVVCFSHRADYLARASYKYWCMQTAEALVGVVLSTELPPIFLGVKMKHDKIPSVSWPIFSQRSKWVNAMDY